MVCMSTRRDVFPLRFKDARVREGLKILSEHSGVPMTDIAEAAIAHEITLQGEDLERRLEEALAVVRSYRPEAHLKPYLDAAEAGELSGIDPFTRVTQEGSAGDLDRRMAEVEDKFGIAAAFSR